MMDLINAILLMQASMRKDFNQELTEIRLRPEEWASIKQHCAKTSPTLVDMNSQTFSGIKILEDTTLAPWVAWVRRDIEPGGKSTDIDDALYLQKYPFTDQERRQILYEKDGGFEMFVNTSDQVNFMKEWRKKHPQPDSINLVTGEVVFKFEESIPANPENGKLMPKEAEEAEESPLIIMDMTQINSAIDEILNTRDEFSCDMECYDDPEAHRLEDRLYHAFVRYVAETADGELQVMALKLLETEALKFSRWYE